MPESKPFVRHARRSDLPTLIDFIRQLADYQNDLACITVTEEKLSRSLCFYPGDTEISSEPNSPRRIEPCRPGRCLLAFDEAGAPAGLALYFYSYITWHGAPGIYLEDLFVLPEKRRGGYGKLLLDALSRELFAIGGARIEWRVLDWNESSIRFYKSIGATAMDGWTDMKLERKDIKLLEDQK